jgi:hypothetical protein
MRRVGTGGRTRVRPGVEVLEGRELPATAGLPVLPAGTPDTSFGTLGVAYGPLPYGGQSIANAVAVGPDG